MIGRCGLAGAVPCWRARVCVQLTAVDGRRALVILPNDPDLVDILAADNMFKKLPAADVLLCVQLTAVDS